MFLVSLFSPGHEDEEKAKHNQQGTSGDPNVEGHVLHPWCQAQFGLQLSFALSIIIITFFISFSLLAIHVGYQLGLC